MCLDSGFIGILLLALPVFVIILSAFSPDEYPKFPPSGISLRWFAGVFSSSGWMESIWVSFMLLLVVTPLAVILGTVAAYALARLNFPGKQAIQAFVLSPLMIPQIALGVSFLYLLTMIGVNGTFAGLAAGHMLISLPYVVRTVGVSMANVDQKLELASMNLGAGPWHTFFMSSCRLLNRESLREPFLPL